MVTVTSGANVQATISGSVTAALPTPSATQTIRSGGNATISTGQSITAGTGIQVMTVTGGKIFYLTGFFYSQNSDANSNPFCLRDGTSVAGTLKFNGSGANSGLVYYSFPVPIPFTTGIWLDVAVTKAFNTYGWVGFEQ